jgi:ribosomal protein L30/L7E
METTEIQERNKQIALMLGLHHDKECVIYEMKAYTWDMLRFHSDWNWLMEAVEFIQKELIKNNDEFCIEFYEGLPGEPMTFVSYAEQNVKSKSSKEAVFIAVSDFAKLYNNKQL